MTNKLKLSECLQNVQIDLAKAVRVVSAVKEVLRNKRSGEAFEVNMATIVASFLKLLSIAYGCLKDSIL